MNSSIQNSVVLRLGAAVVLAVTVTAARTPGAVPVAAMAPQVEDMTPAREPTVGPAGSGGAAVEPAESAVESAGAATSEPVVEAAVRSLAPHVTRSSHPDALRTALAAYYSYRDANADQVRKPYLYFVDLGLSNSTARGYVFDMDALELVEGPFMVAHGRGSSASRNGVPTTFSNRSGSNASSLGLYLAQETYTFRGKSGGRSYSSVGLRMQGESGRFNSAARARGIVAHGAPYVTSRESGRSEGCPAMEQARAARLLPLLANGGVVFIYSPRDANWLREDPWIQAAQAP